MRGVTPMLIPPALLALALCIPAGAAPKFERTTHPDAQWFPEAGLGLFMHWGIHSVAGIQPSWAMIKDYPAGGDPRFHPPDKYYALAKDFNPQNYDPDKWMQAAAEAGFTYAVLTTKHHDGYALWPTHFGDMSTRQYMGGRDLLQPYVDACRRHGLKVGFYFSPVDWHYPGFPVGDVDFDYNKRGKHPPREPIQNQKDFDAFYEYTIGQLAELLTRYGKIDLLWFDGMGWPGIKDIRTEQTLQWVRDLQPGIVINPRWGGVGDFATPEWNFPDGRPSGWWEYCIAWNGHWGYNPKGRFRPTSWVIETLVKCRSWGGNFLLNVGPAPDGTMPQGFYDHAAELAGWMKHSRKSLIGARPTPGDDRANVPITRGEDVWYLHVLPGHRGNIEVLPPAVPKRVRLLATGQNLPHREENGRLIIEAPTESVTGLDDVIEVLWQG
ncbi:MAG: alpha-L-fucosidase [Armatimonadetes bacterium]|nr:alpha-L-fucosidase [Armatimonadota bacterium]